MAYQVTINQMIQIKSGDTTYTNTHHLGFFFISEGESSSNNQQAAALYAFIVLFCLLLLLNIIYIIWYVISFNNQMYLQCDQALFGDVPKHIIKNEQSYGKSIYFAESLKTYPFTISFLEKRADFIPKKSVISHLFGTLNTVL